ncbi:MAG: molybdenum cofactor biosynthesis protein MoaE [Bacteroidia bacterium]|nr:molybdenum cofactor biosynthesis protein MoaE [Bacteroidia bacterium]
MKNIEISADSLSLQRCRDFVNSPANGAEAVFIGTVRNATNGQAVSKLFFEAYESMAIKEMNLIADQALHSFRISKIAIHHRIGELGIGEIPVIIAVGSAHRKAAFQACQYAIDTLKEKVPIWKKEYLTSGEVWVSAHP